jgi:hypothetical protein
MRLSKQKRKKTMKNFTVKNVETESFDTYEMVIFSVVTEKGEIQLQEFLKDRVVCKESDNHIRSNLSDELSKIFDISEKPSLMPVDDFLSDEIDAICDEVQKKL